MRRLVGVLATVLLTGPAQAASDPIVPQVRIIGPTTWPSNQWRTLTVIGTGLPVADGPVADGPVVVGLSRGPEAPLIHAVSTSVSKGRFEVPIEVRPGDGGPIGLAVTVPGGAGGMDPDRADRPRSMALRWPRKPAPTADQAAETGGPADTGGVRRHPHRGGEGVRPGEAEAADRGHRGAAPERRRPDNGEVVPAGRASADLVPVRR